MLTTVLEIGVGVFLQRVCYARGQKVPGYRHQRSKLAGFLVPNAYAAYFIHAPEITAMAFAVRGVGFYPLLKWVLMAPFAVLVCFGLSALIRKIS